MPQSRWAMLGSQLGGGLGQGLNAALGAQLKQRMDIQGQQKQLEFFKSLPPQDQQLYLQMQGAKQQDPLSAILATFLGQSMGGQQQAMPQGGVAPDYGQPQYQVGPSAMTKVQDEAGNVFLQDNQGNLFYEDGTPVQ